jgi:NAD(P)-dependent dehydrogenase (short-subunit alcohol dehydrogenase family)
MTFADRTGIAVVAGGSGGIGGAVVRLLAERGARVAFTYRSNAAAASALAAETGAVAAQLDLTDAAAVASYAESLGVVHTAVYAAGPHVPMRHLSTVPPGDMAAQLANDAGAFFAFASALLPLLRTSSGNLVAVTTAATTRTAIRDGLSAAPKAAVEAMVRGLAAEEGRYGVRVNCVGPGMLTDGMAQRLVDSGDLEERALSAARANTPLRRFGTSLDVAEAVCFLASDAAGFISGQKLDVDGGYGA